MATRDDGSGGGGGGGQGGRAAARSVRYEPNRLAHWVQCERRLATSWPAKRWDKRPLVW